MRPPIEDHGENAGSVCEYWGIKKSEYLECFIQISEKWQNEIGSSSYICDFVNEGILEICHSVEDFKRVSDTLLPYFKQIFTQEDGSLQFAQKLFAAVKALQIDSIEMFETVCRQTFEQNQVNREKEGAKRDGSQFAQYVSNSIIGELQQVVKKNFRISLRKL